jgi:hypothetical protein
MSVPPVVLAHADPFIEAQRVLEAAGSAAIALRSTGGIAIGLRCPSARQAPLAREYGDVDFVALGDHRRQVEALFAEIGYVAEDEFNALHGESRMFFVDPTHGREVDVFIDAVRGCHVLDLRKRLHGASRTLTPADLLLSKLQIRETNHKDYLDILALVIDCELCDDDEGIDRSRLVEVCCCDWGWWRTVTAVAAEARDLAGEILTDRDARECATDRLNEVIRLLDAAPKTRRWKVRAKLGERLPWYETPEELEH